MTDVYAPFRALEQELRQAVKGLSGSDSIARLEALEMCADKLAACLAALGSQSEAWQPIESYDANTCPLDVLIAVDLEDRCVSGEARLHGDEGWYWANNHPTDAWGSRVYPYAWRELPTPPARPADTRKET